MNNEQQNHTNPKVSIIVPVYNVEKYIKKCASSLFEQTYPNIEYIFVNDASTDNSLDTLKHIAKNNLHQHITIVETSTTRVHQLRATMLSTSLLANI